MSTYVALIRGIGPGDPRKSNESLRGVLEELGYEDVRSVISSGNVVFSAPDGSSSEELGDRIEAAWPELRGFTAATIVRSREELTELVDRLPFGDAPHGKESYQLVTFFKTAPDSPPDPPAQPGVQVLGMVDGVLCTVHDTTVTGGPEVMKWLDKTYRKSTTSRTPLTLGRILKKMQG
ncbi:DUF1697 domain-containing protein [Nocardioides nematodiphilus]|uniref:DUF1697 domain-containing protein n=1 Tax=Nocardioides nematodiphilus TaxID=2849669 RepID=UPI001CD95621|nr:DUF1697 domain-containing protein [Nocardioides nematodiphilus]MCA1982780.1 DUF1697 domain-containing protein [Nocardioides nematodiphilus]